VLDACAAPGGKTAHLLERTELDLLALDHDAERLARVGSNLRRLGLHASVQCADAAAPEQWWDGRPFDRILLDAPCTGSGVTRRHPDIRWLRHAGDPARLGQIQLRMANALWRTLRPGGTLLFVTCSLFADEGPRVAKAFLAEHPHDALHHLPVGSSFENGWVLPDALHDGFYYASFERR
jgi:16S rRNA (cytosine967-C5)-methyltransferase